MLYPFYKAAQWAIHGCDMFRVVFFFCCVVVTFQPVYAELYPNAQSVEDWKTLSTDHFNIHFYKGERAQAERVSAIAESVHQALSEKFQWEPLKRTELVITDQFDYSNGFATPLPYNTVYLFVSAPDTNGTLDDYNDWLTLLILHEYTHTLHLDKANGLPEALRSFFGRLPVLFPNAFQPQFLTEGLAVYHETDSEEGYGRGQSSYQAMLMRMEVVSRLKSRGQVNANKREWPLGNGYLYGTYFYQYLKSVYGEKAIYQYVEIYSRQLIPYLSSRASNKVLSKNFAELWQGYHSYLEKIFGEQISLLEQTPYTAMDAMTDTGYSPKLMTADHDALYYVQLDNMNTPKLYQRQRDGSEKALIKLDSPAYIHAHEDAGVLISQIKKYNKYYVYADLYVYKEGSLSRLTYGSRYRRAVWTPDGKYIVAYKAVMGMGQLDVLSAEGEFIKTVWQADNTVLGSFSISPSGELVAQLKPAYGQWNLYRFNMHTDAQWTQLTFTNYIESSPYFKDETTILYTADYTDVSNVYRLDINTPQQAERLTHVLGGVFTPVYFKHAMYVNGYHEKGNDLYQLSTVYEALTVIENVDLTTFDSEHQFSKKYESVNDNNAALVEKDYSPWSTLTPTWWFPLLTLDEQQTTLGFMTSGVDAIHYHAYSVDMSVDVENQLFNTSVAYSYRDFITFSFTQAHAYYSDNISESAYRIKRTQSLDFTQAYLLYSPDMQWGLHWGGGYSRDKNVLVESGYEAGDEEKTGIIGVQVAYNNVKQYAQNISPVDGRYVGLRLETHDIIEGDYEGPAGVFNWVEFFNLTHNHALVFKTWFGKADEKAEQFELGGYNDTLYREFGKRDYALRGYKAAIVPLTGDTMQINTLEYRFPVYRVEETWGMGPIGLNDIYADVFIDTGATSTAMRDARYLTGVGAEVTIELNLGFVAILPIKIGYAYGLDSEYGSASGYVSFVSPL